MTTRKKNIFTLVLDSVRAANTVLITEGVLPPKTDQSRIVVEPPNDPSHGEMASNTAMILAKAAATSPRNLAERTAQILRANPTVMDVQVAGPGFINLKLRPQAWFAELKKAIAEGASYGQSRIGKNKLVNVEYVSANPTGPMHVGHGRGAVFGDALANLLSFTGYRVTREYYVNDAGAQVDVLARSAFLRYREALGEVIGPIPDGLYPGEYLEPVGKALAREFGRSLTNKPEAEWLPVVRECAIGAMLTEIKNDLVALNVRHDEFSSERLLVESGTVERTITALRAKKLVYEGRLLPPKGQPIEDWEDREQTLFRATAFGDDVDRPLMKSDGSYTYFASDIAYHKSKFDRGFRAMIDVWGADHGGYVKRMQAAVKAVSGGKADLDIKLVQLVRLLRGGEVVKMSKRAGEYEMLRDVVQEVGRDAVRFMMLYRNNDAPLDFDLAKVIEQSRDNPVFYVQYAHARAHSVFRNAQQVVPSLPEDSDKRARVLLRASLERLDHSSEFALIKRIGLYPRVVEAASSAHEPHRIAFYLYDLASQFHAHWRRGEESPHLRFIIQNDPQLTKARLALVQGVVAVLASGLALLGVGAPEEMR